MRSRPSPSDRSFRFRPLVPQDATRYLDDDDDDDDDDNIRPGGWHDDDPPPVEFACDSFSLTSPGVGADHRKVYASFQIGRCPFRGGDVDCMGPRPDDNRGRAIDIDDESMMNEDEESIRMSRAIFCLPLVGYDDPPSSPEAIGSYFPLPDACITAQYPVSSFSVDPTGRTIVIGTICGTVEIWRTGMDRRLGPTTPLRVQILSVRESFVMRHRAMTMKARRSPIPPSSNNLKRKINDDANETVDDLALLDNGTLDEVELPHKHPTCKISQMYIPPHLPVQKCGFVTKQRCPEYGTTLLLWQTSNMSSDKHQDTTEERFHITAMINLPLSAQCRPEVHFDGRRLIVFGKDHIGLIILVYHVLGTRYDQNNFDRSNMSPNLPNGEESGGVVQLSGERRIRFVNRIRHAGLGGLEYFDCMLMAANERFIVVNTKTGNLIGSDGARNATEGMLVIDLLEQYDRCP
ncbi:hypothetical protein ACHAW5_011122 [Stephanodiscus triporus]|uniref:Cleavage/polyadenylation specificity factor A subunit N-terminal domain-containing protein n=1 Tax=Stephanodiscus triporus TaxID=2934178 RepID=A0ABD3P5N1_9STRA